MGMEIPGQEEQPLVGEDWPRILLVGPPNVGKRSILNRLLAMGKVKGSPFSASRMLSYGWMMETKYYTVDVCISIASLMDKETRENARAYATSNQCQALVLIFDLSNFSTFDTVQEWVATLDLQNLEILLCVGNKADRLPDHFAHSEYRRRLQKRGESSSEPHLEFWDFGIQQTDGSSLLEDKGDSSDHFRGLCVDWCSEHGIEYLEACGLDPTFDQCISIDGDSQGLGRILGALSAHMWPGLNLKAENAPTIAPDSLGDEGSATDEESEISVDYERLSNGSAEPWDGDEGPWTFYETLPSSSGDQEVSSVPILINQQGLQDDSGSSLQLGDPESQGAVSSLSHTHSPTQQLPAATTNEVHAQLQSSVLSTNAPATNGGSRSGEAVSSETVDEDGRGHQDAEIKDFEHLMMEMSRMRENGRLMSDSQRREMAANLALRMASLFDEDD